MDHYGVMTGMLWAALMMVGVPLAIGAGVLVAIVRRRGRGRDRLHDVET